jgi:hypothetical protein
METWFRLPQLVRGAIIAAAWFGYAYLVLSLLTAESANRIAMYFAIACVMGAAVTVGADGALRSRFGSAHQLTMYYRALRTGGQPGSIEVDKWRRWLSGSELSTGAVALGVGPFVLFGWFSSVTSQVGYRWVPAVAFSLLGVWGLVAIVTRGARIKRLATEVKRRHESVEPAAGTSAEAQRAASRKEGFEASLVNRLMWGFLIQFVCVCLVVLIADLESLVYGGPRIMRLEWAAGLAALMALAFVVLGQERDLRRNFASLEQYDEYSQAVRTEDMPANIEPDVWRRRLKTNRRSNLLRLLCAGFLVGVGLASLVTDQSVYRWMTASLFQLVAIWLLVKWWDTREALASLAAQVERHANRQSWG